MASEDVAEMTIHLTIEGQPECCKRLQKAGWRFEYDSDTAFVSAIHPLGGKQSVVEVCTIMRPGFERDEIGQQIAMLLNGGNHGH